MNTESTILIVDDNLIGRKILEGLLSEQGYILEFAENGKEALEKSLSLIPDIILLDVMMPDMDGFEVCRRLRADPILAEVPVVMVTALDDLDSRLQGIEAGADDFISKPFNDAELLARVRTISRLNRYRRLLAERARFEWVVEQSSEGYLVVNQHDDILYANPQAMLYLGISEENNNIQEKFLALAQKQFQCEPEASWENWTTQLSKMQTAELYLVRPETSTSKAVWLKVAVLNYKGAETERLIRLTDATSSIESQRDMATFHRMLNHKIRSPLNSMLLSIHILADENIDLPKSEALDIARTAYANIQRLDDVISNILEFLETPSQATSSQPFYVSQIPGIISQHEKTLDLPPTQLDIQENLAMEELALSEKAIETILWELMQNAKKFHPLKHPSIEISITKESNTIIKMIIRDNGIALSPEQLSRVWLPYYQAEKYFTGTVDGIGLGLPLVANLVWQMGGKCALFNRDPGPGIIVELILPINSNG